MPAASVYPLSAFEDIPWPEHDAGAKAWFRAFAEGDPHALIPNVWAHVHLVTDGAHLLPVTVTIPHPDNAYVCSPLSHYVTYAKKEALKVEPKSLGFALHGVTRGLGAYLSGGGIEPAVYVNNWLLSTNLYPQLSGEFVDEAHQALLSRFPESPIAFRSVDARGNPALLERLEGLGYTKVFSRFVWYQQPDDPGVYRKKSYRRDGQVFRRSGYRVRAHADFTEADFERAEALYEALYIHKYSPLNPRFTAEFLRTQCCQSHLQLRGLFKDGRMDAVYGYYLRNGFGTCPIFGYDTSLDPRLGLYRCLSWLWAEEARELGVTIHASSGVGAFKRHRGAVPEVEFNMVYTRHLPRAAQRRWQALQVLADRVAVPLIRKQEL